MKTNHRRGFKDPGFFRDPSMLKRTRKLSGRVVQAQIGNDFSRGHHGAARAKSGLKKFLRTRERQDGHRLSRDGKWEEP